LKAFEASSLFAVFKKYSPYYSKSTAG